MDMHSATPASAEARPSSTEAVDTSLLGTTAAVWIDLLAFWIRRREVESETLPAVAAAAAGAAEVTARTYRAVLDANQAAASVIYEAAQQQHKVVCGAARHHQDLVFTTARATVSALEASGAWVDGAPQRVLTAYREACGRALDAVQVLGGAALGAQGRTPPAAEGQARSTVQR